MDGAGDSGKDDDGARLCVIGVNNVDRSVYPRCRSSFESSSD